MESVRKFLNSQPESSTANSSPMKTVFREALEEIGLSQHEIALYQTSLNLGPRPASTLAKGIRVQRTRVYDLLSSLESRGLVEMYERNHVRYYAATPPDRLLTLIRNRREYVDVQLTQLEHAIPKLFATTNLLGQQVESRNVRGTALVKEALLALLNGGERCLLSVGNIEQVIPSQIGTSRWAAKFQQTRVDLQVALNICMPGPPDFIEERQLYRTTLSSPDIPTGQLTVANSNTVILLGLSSTSIQGTVVQNQLFCSVLHGLYNSWLHSVQRIA